MMKGNQTCIKCVMDSSDPSITFNNKGICKYCCEYERILKRMKISKEKTQKRLDAIAEEIKSYGRGHDYDSLLGLSGGVDSSYVAYLAKQMEYRPLLVNVNNGWDSKLAVENVKLLVDKLGYDLYTYTINWQEFKDMQRSLLKASVIDIEILSDHVITAALFKIARENKIKYILTGGNIATEYGMPKAWVWRKQDLSNIKAIQKQFGTKKIQSLPTFSTWQRVRNAIFKQIRYIKLLNYIDYRKNEAIEILSSSFGWQYYGGKHYESIFTKFYQAYILPEKFDIDKRKSHFSSLIRNGEMTRNEALEELQKPPYEPKELHNDMEYVINKLGFSKDEFEEIMQLPIKSHTDYPSDERILRYLDPLIKIYEKIFEY